MKNLSYRYRPLCAAFCLSVLSLAAPLASGASDANMSAETAGERASFARAFCDVSPERIDAYKERLRKVLTGATDFDQHWDTGWHRADITNSQMNALRERDPKEFAARIKVNCERLKWMAGNALHRPAQK
ncbi:hypothetical protein OKW38_003226 [Paraburkholderia sp. MM5496-R1]|uniref:Lysozyme inhibitor LprI N-terminal domain-containing protein n=1 Tax=Paraburkholderia tuberum TaxID=157910 RepID=A0A1H1F0C9_9BURK|nr:MULTISPECIES: hypothetical protein [Paraburkholderia]MBC8726323.1 hypothetical protein [Paraburkholderia sp. 31.1]SDQ94348.1 hypothetical protein SAMN05445850_2206 [Paraburkholderia tuberum]